MERDQAGRCLVQLSPGLERRGQRPDDRHQEVGKQEPERQPNDYATPVADPLLYLNETKNFTVALGLPLLNSRYVSDIQQTMAQTVLAVIPVMLVFFFAQRFYIQGIVVTGVKG